MRYTTKLLFVVLLTMLPIVFACKLYNLANKSFEDEIYNPSLTHIQDVYDRLERASGQMAPELLVLKDDPTVNASDDGQFVRLYGGLLRFMKNDDELALVLAHEIAHYNLKHTEQPYPADLSSDQRVEWDLQRELNADKAGAFMMMQAGFNVCEGRKIWLAIRNEWGDPVENLGHPTDIFRYVNLRLPSCDGVEL